MGLLDKVKSNMENAVEKTKEIDNSRKERSQKKKIEETNKILKKYNIFEGINSVVTFPEKEITIKSHGGVTKGIATLGFGLAGLAATSSVKQEKKNRSVATTVQIVDKGIVFKKATADEKDLRIPYDNIIKIEHINSKRNIHHAILTLLENQTIKISLSVIELKREKYSNTVYNHMVKIINERATGMDHEETGWGLDYATGKSLSQPEDNNDINELEKIVNMYEKGLLTDDEFTAMKKKIIEK